MITFAEAYDDPNIFGPWFQGDSWNNWRVVTKALFGLPLATDELSSFTALTGLDTAPTSPVGEAWLICGRRGGKDVNAAAIVTYLATIGADAMGFLERLTPGERGVVQLLAVDRDQARVALSYIRAMFEQPMLKAMVSKTTADGLELTNRLSIEVTTNDQRRVRGRTVVATVFDEVAFWRGEGSASPDDEVYRAVKPAMATIPGAMLIGISSPYAKRGLLYRKWKKHYGKPGNVLVVKAPTWVMNPTLPRDGEFLSEAFEDDPVGAAAEYGAEFRNDIEQFVPLEVVEACVSEGVYERAWKSGNQYRAFVDPSGGSSDSMTLAIAHLEKNRAILDVMREVKPPFSPAQVVEEFAGLIRSYGCHKVTGDAYAGEWPREVFRDHRVDYEVADRTRSELYRDMLPLLNSGRADLLDSDRLVSQIVSLERRTGRSGREIIDHAPNSHDDLANAVAGALCEVAAKKSTYDLMAAMGVADEWW